MGALLLMCSIPSTARLATQNPTSTAFIDLRRAEAAAEGKKFDLELEWRPLGKISRYLRAAVVYSEDWRFYDHDGVDWDAIEHAIHANIGKGAMAIGGSTITQQLAKNLYLSPSRSLLRKLRELLIAFSLEDHLSKTRILELYLNVCEWGDGVFGAEAASQHWFHHSAQTLTPAEAVRLAIALPNPFKRAPNVRSKELTKKSVRLIRLLRIQGLINTDQERVALDSVGAAKTPVIAKTKQLKDIDDDVPDGEGPDTPAPSEPVTKPDQTPPDPMPPQEPTPPPPTE
ncbi:MAG TPA: monofunctional biosynthetic peptidoglycan transglycosylase [Kofleriaceae bacterium]